jgi:hypothetical protein
MPQQDKETDRKLATEEEAREKYLENPPLLHDLFEKYHRQERLEASYNITGPIFPLDLSFEFANQLIRREKRTVVKPEAEEAIDEALVRKTSLLEKLPIGWQRFSLLTHFAKPQQVKEEAKKLVEEEKSDNKPKMG